MNLLFRFTWLILRSLLNRIDTNPFYKSQINFRVLPTDCDINAHMTNSRYMSFMDLGRVHFLLMTPLRISFWRGRWRPIVAGVLINFYKSLKPFESFDVITELKGCDFKWIYMEQRIEVEGQIYARAYIRGLFRNQSGNVSPAKVMEALGRGDESIVNSSVSNLFENITTLKL